MVICQYFLKGTCRFGDRCRFEHPSPASARTVCQHFLRGSCRFGDRCKNEHPSGGHAGFGGNQSGFGGHTFGNPAPMSSLRWSSGHSSGQAHSSDDNLNLYIVLNTYNQPHFLSAQHFKQRHSGQNMNRFEVLSHVSEGDANAFGAQKPVSSQESGHTPSQIQQTIQKDLEAWEVNNQWPLSCYSYSRGPCIPGLTDYSPEELRQEAYKCNAEGKPAPYQQGLAELIGKHKQRRTQLKNMSAAQIHEVIVKSSTGETGLSADTGFSSVFGGSGSSQGTGGQFSGAAVPSQPMGFGNSSSVGQSGGLFGSGTSSQQSGGLFGSSSSASQSGGMFGGTTTQQLGQSFGSSSQSGGLFGNKPELSSSSSMATQSSGINQPVAIFGSGVASGTFGSQNAGLVGSSQSLGAFGNAGQGSATSSAQAVPETSQVAVGMAAAASSAFKCSEEDLQAFRAPMFTLGKIPECPPPLELC